MEARREEVPGGRTLVSQNDHDNVFRRTYGALELRALRLPSTTLNNILFTDFSTSELFVASFARAGDGSTLFITGAIFQGFIVVTIKMSLEAIPTALHA